MEHSEQMSNSSPWRHSTLSQSQATELRYRSLHHQRFRQHLLRTHNLSMIHCLRNQTSKIYLRAALPNFMENIAVDRRFSRCWSKIVHQDKSIRAIRRIVLLNDCLTPLGKHSCCRQDCSAQAPRTSKDSCSTRHACLSCFTLQPLRAISLVYQRYSSLASVRTSETCSALV